MLFLSTTGTDVAIPELGTTIVHPTTDYQIDLQFEPEEIRDAASLTSAILAGTLVWRKTAGGAIQLSSGYDADYVSISKQNTSTGINNDRAATIGDLFAATGPARFVISTTFNGNVGNNSWLGYNELLPGNNTPIILPVNCVLKEIAVSFNGGSVDGRINLYKNGTGGGDIIDSTTFTFVNVNQTKIFTGLNYSFAAGDTLRGRWIDLGDNPSDMAVTYFFQTV